MKNFEIVETVLRAVLASDGLTESEIEITAYNCLHGFKSIARQVG